MPHLPRGPLQRVSSTRPSSSSTREQHVHLLEAAGDRRVEHDLELAEQGLHVGLGQPFIGEGADADLAVEQRARRRVLQRELAVEAGLGRGRLT